MKQTVMVSIIVLHAYLLNCVARRARIYASNDAEKGQNIQITCDLGLTPEIWIYSVNVFKTPSPDISTGGWLTMCNKEKCLPRQHSRYTFASDGYHVLINITRLNRTEDEMFWTCRSGDLKYTDWQKKSYRLSLPMVLIET